MRASRLLLLLAVFLGMSTLGGRCGGGGGHDPVIIPPDWEIWSDPSHPVALDVTDPSGDDLGYGDTADWSMMQGTYDGSFVYIHVDVYSSPAIDQTGDIGYNLGLDANGNATLDAGDFVLMWDAEYGLAAGDYQGNLTFVGAWVQPNPAGGIDFAIPRSLVNQTSFNLFAGILYWDGNDWQDGDDMPNPPTWGVFNF
jgi:hypothetical protein